jgi:hypothetical protein
MSPTLYSSPYIIFQPRFRVGIECLVPSTESTSEASLESKTASLPARRQISQEVSRYGVSIRACDMIIIIITRRIFYIIDDALALFPTPIVWREAFLIVPID